MPQIFLITAPRKVSIGFRFTVTHNLYKMIGSYQSWIISTTSSFDTTVTWKHIPTKLLFIPKCASQKHKRSKPQQVPTFLKNIQFYWQYFLDYYFHDWRFENLPLSVFFDGRISYCGSPCSEEVFPSFKEERRQRLHWGMVRQTLSYQFLQQK